MRNSIMAKVLRISTLQWNASTQHLCLGRRYIHVSCLKQWQATQRADGHLTGAGVCGVCHTRYVEMGFKFTGSPHDWPFMQYWTEH